MGPGRALAAFKGPFDAVRQGVVSKAGDAEEALCSSQGMMGEGKALTLWPSEAPTK